MRNCLYCKEEVAIIKYPNSLLCSNCIVKKHEEDKKPLFTTKHYKAIAEVLNHYYKSSTIKDYRIVGWFIEKLKKDNPKFDSKKFWELVK